MLTTRATFFLVLLSLLLLPAAYATSNPIFLIPPTYDSAGIDASSVAVADVNGDGIADLMVANQCVSSSNCSSGSVAVLLGQGDGTFQAAMSYSTGVSAQGLATVVVGDVNGDGKPDVVMGGYGNVSVLLGKGDGTFQAAVVVASGGFSFSALADVNGDGKLDLIVNDSRNCNYSCVGILLGRGDGTFGSVVNYDAGGLDVTSVAVADLNADGKPDLVVSTSCGYLCGANEGPVPGHVGVLLGNGDGTFKTVVDIPPPGFWKPAFVAVADLNGDGKPDLVVGDGGSNVVVFFGNGNGTFYEAGSYSLGSFVGGSVVIKDINGDGKADLLVEGGGCVGVLLGNGNGTFQTAVSYVVSARAAAIAVADVNGDGRPDLIAASPDNGFISVEGSVAVYLGKGDGTFPAPISYTAGYSPFSVTIGDVNGDGTPDIVAANNGEVDVLLGNGDGTFKADVEYAAPGTDTPLSIVLADVNGDGKPDILMASENIQENVGSDQGILREGERHLWNCGKL